MKIAVDVMGTDYGPKELVLGAVDAVRAYGCQVVLVGDEETIKKLLVEYKADKSDKISVVHASQVIGMAEHPAIAIKRKKDASIVVASRLLKNNECDALVSSGSTGAAVAAALFEVGRIDGVERPAIATTIPSEKGVTIMLDSGAVVDAKPEQLVKNAIMGSVFAESVLNIDAPKVGLLNIGEEKTKGNEQALETWPLLQKTQQINFIGNVEGRDITKGTADVVVCDAFVGNVVLKFGEGLAATIMTMMKEAVMSGGFLAKLGAMLMKPALEKVKKKMDVQEYGGAMLLGIKAPFMICHGSSKAKAITSAIRMLLKLTEQDMVHTIGKRLADYEKSEETVQ